MIQDHAIETLEMACVFAHEADAWAFQDRMTAFMRGRAQSILREVFDRSSPPGEVWAIDALEVDLGELDPEGTDDEWGRRLAECLEDQLRNFAQSRGQTLSARPVQGTWHTQTDRDLAAVLHYLKRGYLPWSMNVTTQRSLGEWLQGLAERSGPRFWRALQQLAPEPRILERLGLAMPSQALQTLLQNQHPGLAEGLGLAEEALLNPLQASGRLSGYQARQVRQAWRLAGLEALWGPSSGTLSQGRLERLWETLREVLARVLGKNWVAIWSSLRGARRPSASAAQPSKFAQHMMRGLLGSPSAEAGLEPPLAPARDLASRRPGETLREHGLPKTRALHARYVKRWEGTVAPPAQGLQRTQGLRPAPARLDGESPWFLEAGPIHVANAGLVLLAPFLQRLFAAQKLTQDRGFVDDAARARAIHELEFLLHGHTLTAEPGWVLDKLLCGVPLEQPVPPCEALDEGTVAALEGLLKAVIAHWQILGKTSVAGLRESFLVRPGRLTSHQVERAESWELQVEPKAYDMLLDRLPWSFATIRLPWMEGVIHVNWR